MTTWHQFAARIVERAGIRADRAAVDGSRFSVVTERQFSSVLDNSKIAKAAPMRPWQDAPGAGPVRKGRRSP